MGNVKQGAEGDTGEETGKVKSWPAVQFKARGESLGPEDRLLGEVPGFVGTGWHPPPS